jgi:hypothetical protein
MPLIQAEIDAAAEVLFQLAPELRDRIYVVAEPVGMPDNGSDGYASSLAVHPAIKAQLEHQGRWEGQRPRIVICQEFDGAPDDNSLYSRQRLLLGLMLHEASHILPLDPIAEIAYTPEVVAQLEREHIAWSRHTGSEAGLPGWFGDHDAPFIRRCVHLWYRAIRAGHYLDPRTISFVRWDWAMGPTWSYIHALDVEPEKMLGATFTEICALPIPKLLHRCLGHDLQYFLSSKSQRGDAATTPEPADAAVHADG